MNTEDASYSFEEFLRFYVLIERNVQKLENSKLFKVQKLISVQYREEVKVAMLQLFSEVVSWVIHQRSALPSDNLTKL